jgi:hypothetical protein
MMCMLTSVQLELENALSLELLPLLLPLYYASVRCVVALASSCCDSCYKLESTHVVQVLLLYCPAAALNRDVEHLCAF